MTRPTPHPSIALLVLLALAPALPGCESRGHEMQHRQTTETAAPDDDAMAQGSGHEAATTPVTPRPEALPARAFVPSTLRQEELRGIAMSALDHGDDRGAVEALIALQQTPEMSDLKASGMLLLADLYHLQGDHERALAVLRALLDQAPPMAEFEFVLGRTLGDLRRPDQAETHLRRAIALNPEFLQSYLYLGSVLVATGREEQAAVTFLAYEQVLADLMDEVENPDTELSRRLAIIESLGYANPDERITQCLLRLLGEDSVVINAAAIGVLAQVGTPEALPQLSAFAQQTAFAELRTAAEQAAQAISLRAP